MAASRQKMEDELTNTLEDIKEHLPNLIVYEQIYRNASLGKKIAAAYTGVILFSREATRYCIANHGYSKCLTTHATCIFKSSLELIKL